MSYNNPIPPKEAPHARIHTTIKVSADGGENWEKLIEVDEQGGYPDIAVSGNTVYVLYEVDPVKLGCVVRMVLKKYVLKRD
jgi:hypothetical protein